MCVKTPYACPSAVRWVAAGILFLSLWYVVSYDLGCCKGKLHTGFRRSPTKEYGAGWMA